MGLPFCNLFPVCSICLSSLSSSFPAVFQVKVRTCVCMCVHVCTGVRVCTCVPALFRLLSWIFNSTSWNYLVVALGITRDILPCNILLRVNIVVLKKYIRTLKQDSATYPQPHFILCWLICIHIYSYKLHNAALNLMIWTIIIFYIYPHHYYFLYSPFPLRNPTFHPVLTPFRLKNFLCHFLLVYICWPQFVSFNWNMYFCL